MYKIIILSYLLVCQTFGKEPLIYNEPITPKKILPNRYDSYLLRGAGFGILW